MLTARATDNGGAVGTSAAITGDCQCPGQPGADRRDYQPGEQRDLHRARGDRHQRERRGQRRHRGAGGVLIRARRCSAPTRAPRYSFTWSNAPAGTYSLTARAFDNASGTATSSAVNVTVNPAPPQATSVAFTPVSYYGPTSGPVPGRIRRAAIPSARRRSLPRHRAGRPSCEQVEITADISSTVNPLAPGLYYAVVVAVNPAAPVPARHRPRSQSREGE